MMEPLTGRLRRFAGWLALPLAVGLVIFLVIQALAGEKAEAALSNPGFEMGSLYGWTTGATTEGVFVVETDTINAAEGVSQAPLEGQYMARLGNPQPDDNQTTSTQPQGPNELIQQFTIEGPFVKFAYNIWTYDYTGFDRFSIELRLVNTDTVIYSYSQQAWGASWDTSRKNTGWQVVSIPVGQYQGQLARLTISAGGSEDDLFAFWAYIDSAETVVPAQCVDLPGIKVNGHNTTHSAANQTINVNRPPGGAPWHIDVPVVCPDGSAPASVTLIVGSTPPISVPLVKGTDNLWGADIPTPPGVRGQSFPLTLVLDCPGQTITILIGSITLVDPSGYITDAQTGQPLPEATVTLERLEGSNWVTVNAYATNPDGSPQIAPQVNPQLTDDTGHYGWDVIAGTYRVVVQKTGYVSQTSPQVTVPPPVINLNLALVPVGGPTPTPTPTPPSGNKVGDVDCSGAVDAVDALKILRHVAGLSVSQNEPCPDIGSSVASVFGDVETFAADDWYPKFDLDHANASQPNDVTISNIIGMDDRVQVTDTAEYPFSAIAWLELYDELGILEGSCTGTFIGPDAVLTAAHCLYDYDSSSWTRDIAVVPGKNGAYEPYGFEWASEWSVPTGWTTSGDPLYDWGIIKMADNGMGNTVGWFTIANLTTNTLERPDFQPAIVGYPGDKPYGTMWFGAKNSFLSVGPDELTYEIDTTPGQSGSAIFSANTSAWFLGYIVGIHAYGTPVANSGQRIDADIMNALLSWCADIGCTISHFTETSTPTPTPTPTSIPTLTPTPTPPSGNKVGDVDCSSAVDAVDALKTLRHVAGLSVSQTEPCPDIGSASP